MKVTRKFLDTIIEYEAIEYNNYIHYLGTTFYGLTTNAGINSFSLEIDARDQLIAIYENQIIPKLINIIKENL